MQPGDWIEDPPLDFTEFLSRRLGMASGDALASLGEFLTTFEPRGRVVGANWASTPTPVPEPDPSPIPQPEPVTPDSPEAPPITLPSFEDSPPVNPVASWTPRRPPSGRAVCQSRGIENAPSLV